MPDTLPPPKSLVSLFAGASGLDAGLEQAGFTTKLAIDNDPDAIASLESTKTAALPSGDGRTYLGEAQIVQADLTKTTKAQLKELWGFAGQAPTLLAGGPPCQSFSSAGRMRGLDDARGRLFRDFVRAARALRPEFILFENVQGLVTARDAEGHIGGVLALIQDDFERAGYACRFALVNAADYGCPQRRIRLVMFGAKRFRLPEVPPVTHAKDTEDALLPSWRTVRDALRDMPPADEADIVRPKPSLEEKLSTVAPGQGIRVGGTVEANRPNGHWGYRQDGFIAAWDQPSRTIRSASTPDWLRLPDGSHRRLTWAECARLQGFPEGWRFEGTTTSRFRQIGNAVPVELAYALGQSISEALAAGELPRGRRPESADWPKSFHRRIRYTQSEHRVNGHLRRQGIEPVSLAS